MCKLALLLLWLTPAPLLQAEPAVQEGQEAPEAQVEAPPSPTTQEGAMRLVLTAIGEQRIRMLEPLPNETPSDWMRIQVKIKGAELPDVARVGQLIIEEMVDDTGRSLIDPAKYDETRRTETRPFEVNDRIIQGGGIPLVEQVGVSARGSTKLTSLKASVKVVYATGLEEIRIESPMDYRGGVIEHPRLRELGVQIRVFGPGEEGVAEGNTELGLHIVSGEDRVKSVEFFDDWFRRINARPRSATTAAGDTFTVYSAAPAQYTRDGELLLKVFTNIRSDELKLETKDVALP